MENPFTARRKKKEEKLMAQLEAQQQQMPQEQVMMPPPSAMPQLPMIDSSDGPAHDPYASEDFNKYLPASAHVEQQAPTWNGGGRATYEPPSRARQCFSKLQSGFMIGASLGGAFGFLYGTYAAIKFKHVLYLPIAVVQAGGAFGFFLAAPPVTKSRGASSPGTRPFVPEPGGPLTDRRTRRALARGARAHAFPPSTSGVRHGDSM